MKKDIHTEKDYIKGVIKWLKRNHLQNVFSLDELKTVKEDYQNLWTNLHSLENFEEFHTSFTPTENTLILLKGEVEKVFKRQAKVLLRKLLETYLVRFFKEHPNQVVTSDKIMKKFEKDERLVEDLLTEYRLEFKNVVYRLINNFRQKLSLNEFKEGYLISITSSSVRKVKKGSTLESGWIYTPKLTWAFQYLEEQRQKHLKTVQQFENLIEVIRNNLTSKELENLDSDFENNIIKKELIETIEKETK